MPSCFVSLCFLFTTRNRAKLAPRHFCLLRVLWQRVNKTRHKHKGHASFTKVMCQRIPREIPRTRIRVRETPWQQAKCKQIPTKFTVDNRKNTFSMFPAGFLWIYLRIGTRILWDVYKIWNIKLILSSGEFKKVSNRRLGDENRQFIQTCLEFIE